MKLLPSTTSLLYTVKCQPILTCLTVNHESFLGSGILAYQLAQKTLLTTWHFPDIGPYQVLRINYSKLLLFKIGYFS